MGDMIRMKRLEDRGCGLTRRQRLGSVAGEQRTDLTDLNSLQWLAKLLIKQYQTCSFSFFLESALFR